ncbi:MAG: FAD:protein transferase, partial [Frankiaceae bacterium]|nr:FAD:protein transferase [Frankiaceae bacterium]
MTSTTSRRDREDVAVRALGLAGTRWRALGTSAQVVVTAPGRLPAAWLAVRQVLDDIDVAASRFRSDSELAAVNRAAGHWVSVSPLLCRVVRVALVAAEETDGLVDPTVGASLVRLGYDRTFRLVPADAPAVSLGVADVPGWQSVDLDVSCGRVRIPPDTVIDLGATAKGYAADLAAQAAEHATGCG